MHTPKIGDILIATPEARRVLHLEPGTRVRVIAVYEWRARPTIDIENEDDGHTIGHVQWPTDALVMDRAGGGMPLTADTITDEQIRELRAWGIEHCRMNSAACEYREWVRGWNAQYQADVALGNRRARRAWSRARARARCAEILNARGGAK